MAVVALTITGCGGGGGSTKTATPATTSTTAPGAPSNEAFNQCMLSHGVNPAGVRGGATPSSLPAGVTAEQYQTAFQACRSQLPAGGQNPQNSQAFAAYRNCLQLHGVTLPQPGQGPGGSGQTPRTTIPGSAAPGGARVLGNLDTPNPTVQAALLACAALRPSGGPGSSTTTPAS
jgi:hypothetical protein